MGRKGYLEHLLEEANGSAGLGQSEVRDWHSGYRQLALARMAHAWLTLLPQADAQKKCPSPFGYC